MVEEVAWRLPRTCVVAGERGGEESGEADALVAASRGRLTARGAALARELLRDLRFG